MDIQQYLPSKKFQWILLITILVVGIVAFIFIKKSNSTEYQKEITAPKEKVVLGSVVYNDADGDGLLNWEEALWGTDPDNPDTDGDSFSDGTEVKNGYNPSGQGKIFQPPTTTLE